jgi:hypothetical protein
MTTIYPRFLGVDGSGDFVWELPTGRWTWGDSPYDAAFRERTFEPERYIEKYGRPIPFVRIEEETGKVIVAETIDRKAEADQDPAELAKLYAEPTPAAVPVDRGGPLGAPGRRGAHRALKHFLGVLDGWIDGAKSNHQAMPHRGENTGSECWREFAPSDIRTMINDAARELGLAEFPTPTEPEEDKPL